MSYLLRHGAVKEQVPISPEGKMKVSDLISWLRRKGKKVDHALVMDVIQSDAKGRYSYDPEHDLIWAAQGHSMDLVVKMEPWLGHGPLVHASYKEHIQSIRQNGLSRMSRQHIHMIDPSAEGAWDLVRKKADLYVIIDSDKARASGVTFMRSDNGVILSAGIEDGVIPSECLVLIPAPRKTGCYGFIIKGEAKARQGQERGKDVVLMVQTESGYYGFPKGKKNKGEHSLACAFRELYEESGLRPDSLTLLPCTVEEINDNGNCPTVYFKAVLRTSDLPKVMCLDDDEGLDTRWLTLDDIDRLSDREFVKRRRVLL